MIDISICMVSLNCWPVLQDCLESLRASSSSVSHEIIIVDNGSTDGIAAWLLENYPDVKFVENGRNAGFTRGTNQAIALSSGRFLLWLNTDTILRPDSLAKLVEWMDAKPRTGIVGPKVLNPDGGFQPQCRRGLPTPLASLSYYLHLDRLWPNNPALGQYLQTHLPIDQPCQVAAVSGCCLLARREVYTQIGPLDEEIFAFGEDIDWCVRAENAGWEVWYNPESVITHLKGQGGVHSKPFGKIRGMHHGMWVFYRKHLRAKYSWPVSWLMTPLVIGGIAVSFGFASLRVWASRLRPSRQSPRGEQTLQTLGEIGTAQENAQITVRTDQK